jgi:hypothetical protein
MAAIPASFTAGDLVTWTQDAAPEGTTAITAYLRTNAASGATVSASGPVDGVWTFTLPAATTAQLTPGDWRLQEIATVNGNPVTINNASFAITRSLAYSGSPAAVDLRSQAQQDLDAVEAAIRALTTGAQEYWIGNSGNGRKVRRADLAELIKWRDRLKAQVAAEKRAEDIANGLGDGRRLYVRFTPVL